jgi:hypothetical protein
LQSMNVYKSHTTQVLWAKNNVARYVPVNTHLVEGGANDRALCSFTFRPFYENARYRGHNFQPSLWHV